MINKIIKNIKNNSVYINDIKYLFKLNNPLELEIFFHQSTDIQSENFNTTCYESNIYYPQIYQIENNCPTCGYRSSLSRQKYSEEFISRSIEYRLSDIADYPISGINCYNKGITGIRELLLILNSLKKYDLNVNVKVSDYHHLKNIKNFNINSIIFQSSLNKYNSLNYNNDNEKIEENEEVLKYIKQKLKFQVTYEFLINYSEGYHDIVDKIDEIKKYAVDIIEIKGYDPFIDTPEEYNPQYTQDYILKIISLLRICFPDKEIKIQYATNGNNDIPTYLKNGVNTITGIYTPRMNSKLQNVEQLREIKNYVDKFFEI